MDFTSFIRTFIAIGIGILLGTGISYLFFPRVKELVDEEGMEKRKIVELVSVRGKVSVNEVGAYLGVHPDTAGDYLRKLEKRGVVRRSKTAGTEIFYEPVPAKKK